MSAHRGFVRGLFDGEIAVGTGGGSGLGYAIARDFGAQVVVTSRSADRLADAEARIADETGLRRTSSCGPTRCRGRAFDTVVDTDVAGTFNVTRSFVAAMLDARRGAVLNITLSTPERGFPGFSHCGAAKAAIVSLTSSWALRVGPRGFGSTTSLPAPSPPRASPSTCSAPAFRIRAFAGLAGHTPLRRLGTPEDIAAAGVFLCSPAAAWITGHNLVVDGGYCLNGPSTAAQF